MKLTFLEGDATDPVGDSHKVIIHCVNNEGKWGSGFVLSISKRWKTPEVRYREWARFNSSRSVYNLDHSYSKDSIPFNQGQIQLVQVKEDITVCNLIGQSYTGSLEGFPPVRYGALQEGLIRLRETINSWSYEEGISLHMGRICCGLAQAKWSKVETIITEVFIDTNTEIFVYDLPTKNV